MELTPLPINPNAAAGASPAATPNASSLTGGQALGQEEFLKMLVTQLSNQDPLNPLEGHEFAAQLAQFTSVEQLVSLNETLAGQGEMFNLLAETMGESLTSQVDLLGTLTDSLHRSAAAGLVGQTVEVATTAQPWTGEGSLALSFELDAPGEGVSVIVRDAAGAVMGTFPAGAFEAGRHTLDWDGTDADGHRLPPGSYTVALEAVDATGQPFTPILQQQGVVDRVSFGPQGVLVWVDGVAVPFSDITSIGASDAPEAPAFREIA